MRNIYKSITILFFIISFNGFSQTESFDGKTLPITSPFIIDNPTASGGEKWKMSNEVHSMFDFLGYGGSGDYVVLHSSDGPFGGFPPGWDDVQLNITNLDFSSYNNPRMKFYINNQDGNEIIKISASKDGSQFDELLVINSNYDDWTAISVDLSAYSTLTGVSIRISGFEGSLFGGGNFNVGIDELTISDQVDMSFKSSEPTHVGCGSLKQGFNDQEVMRIEVVTEGNLNPLKLTSLELNDNGSDSSACDYVLLKKLYYTGSNSTFNTSNIVRSISVSGDRY